MSKTILLGVCAAVLIAGATATAPASARGGVKVGVLTCNVEGGFGFILGSSKDVRCNFSPNKGYGEHYVGSINKVGVDIGYTKGGVIIWDVVAPSSNMKPGALEGSYVGATAEVTAGVGVGANVLIGGFDKSVALQPVSVEGNTGLNVAAGIGALDLKFQRS